MAKLNIIDTMVPIDANASNFRYMMNNNRKAMSKSINESSDFIESLGEKPK